MEIREFFGMEPSQESRSKAELMLDVEDLQQQLDDSRAKVATLTEENNMLREDAGRNVDTMDGYSETIRELRDQVRRLEHAGPIARYAARVLLQREKAGEILLGADEVAKGVVVERVVDQATATVADNLIEEKEAEIRDEQTPDALRQLREDQDFVMENDGTYDELRKAIEAEERAEVRERLKAEMRANVQEHLDSPEVQEAMIEQELRALADSGELRGIEEEAMRDRKKGWREQAIQRAQAEITAAIEIERAAYIAQYGKDWTESYEGRQYRETKEYELKREWAKKTVVELRAVVDDELLKQAIDDKAEATMAELADEALRRDHLDKFLKGGMDTTGIPDGSEVLVQMGSAEVKTDWGNSYNRSYQYIQCARQIGLTARGDGSFIVNTDTLSADADPYVADNALQTGDIIYIGRSIRSKGKETFTTDVKSGVPLAIDDDKSTPETFTNAYLNVVK